MSEASNQKLDDHVDALFGISCAGGDLIDKMRMVIHNYTEESLRFIGELCTLGNLKQPNNK